MTYPPVPYAVKTRCGVGLCMSTAVAHAGYAAATPCGVASRYTREPTTPSESTAATTRTAPTIGAPRDARTVAAGRGRPAWSDLATAAAIAVHGGTMTATHSAVLRTEMSASPAPAPA